jgi:hypothetical protein
MRKVAVLLVACVASASLGAGPSNTLATAEIGSVLQCLGTKLEPIGYAPPRFASQSFHVRYLLNETRSTDKGNELSLVVYGPGGKKAMLYEVYLENNKGQPSIYIGEMGTLKRKGAAMEPDEIWGGVGTYYEVKRLVKRISGTATLSVPTSQVKHGPRACVFER